MRQYAPVLLNRIIKYNLDKRSKIIAGLKRRLEEGRVTEGQARIWLLRIQGLVDEQERYPNPFPAAPEQDELGQFDIEIGELIENNARIGIRFLDRPRHILISGATGTGKSCLLRFIINQIDALSVKTGRNICILVIDIKGDYLHLPDLLGRNRWDLYDWQEGFRIGLNSPGDLVPVTSWINQLTKIIRVQYGLIFSESTLAAAIRIALSALNDPPQKQMIWPSLALIYEILLALPYSIVAKKKEYKLALEQRLEALINNSGTLFKTFHGFNVLEHLILPQRSAVLSLTNISPLLANIVIEIIASQILLYKLAIRDFKDTTDFFLVIDESDYACWSKISAAYPEGYSALGQFLKQSREVGAMAGLGMTFIGSCCQFISSNASYHIIFNPADAQSTFQAVRNLQSPQCGRLLQSLQQGNAVFKEVMGRCSYPMLIQADYEPPSRDGRPSTFIQHGFMPAKTLAELPQLQDYLKKLKAEKNKINLSQKQNNSVELSENSRTLLEHIYEHPFVPCSRLWKMIGNVPWPAQHAAHKEIVNLELAWLAEDRIGSTNQYLAELRDKSYAFLQKPPQKYKSHGKTVHTHYCQWCCMLGRKRGYKAQAEHPIPGTNHPADCVWWIDNQLHVFECIDTCESNLLSHLKACFLQSHSIASVTIVAAQKTILNRIRKTVQKQNEFTAYLDRIHYLPAESILKELWP